MSSEKASLLEGQDQRSSTATRVLKKIGRGVAGTLGIPLKGSQSVSFYKDLWFLWAEIMCRRAGSQRDLDCAVSCRVTSPHHSGYYCLCWVVLWVLVTYGGFHVFLHCMLKKAVSYIHSQATCTMHMINSWSLYRGTGISDCVVYIPVHLVNSSYPYWEWSGSVYW